MPRALAVLACLALILSAGCAGPATPRASDSADPSQGPGASSPGSSDGPPGEPPPENPGRDQATRILWEGCLGALGFTPVPMLQAEAAMPAGFTPVSFTEAAGYGQDEDPTAALVTFNLICERGKADNGTSLDDPSAAAMAYFAHPPPDYVVDGASEYAILLAYGMSDPFMRAALQQWGNPSVKEADLNRAQLASNVEEFSYSIPGAVAGMLTIDGAQSLPTAQPFLVAFDVVASEILGSFEVRFDGMESRAGPSVLNSATPSEGQLVRPGAGALLGGASLTVEFAMREPSPG